MFINIKTTERYLGSPQNILRFVYDPISINFKSENEMRYVSCGTVLIRKEVKDTIDSVFEKIFRIDIEYKMDTTYGDIVSEVSKEMCERKEYEHLKICRCGYEKPRIWAHDFYYMLMQKFAKTINKTERELKEILTDFRINAHEILSKYDCFVKFLKSRN